MMLKGYPTYTAIVVCACLAATAPTHAINLVMNFDSTNSLQPNFDPNGTGLTSLFNHVETYYQSIFEHSGHTLTITYRYANLTGFIGLHTYGSADANGRENTATIQIDPTIASTWWIDPTPADDSEFTMNQTLWRNLTTGPGGQVADWYTSGGANVPDTFETGFTGAATAMGGALGNTDMLSVVFHEVGHALGLSGNNPLTQNETNDGDYDFDPDYVAGQSFAVETANNSGDDNANIAHLENGNALMNPGIGTSLRRRPSHTDLFTMATVNFYDDDSVDVPRKEFYQNSNWQNPDNWSGHRPPDAGDDVFIRDAQPGTTLTARLWSANGVADDLFVSEGARFDTDAFTFTADDVDVTDTGSIVRIDPGGKLDVDRITVRNDAAIHMNGGTIDATRITLDPGTLLEARNNTELITIDVSDRLVVNGTLRATNNATIEFKSADPDAWNLDGANANDGNGVLDATDGNMDFTESGFFNNDPFSGTMTIGQGHFISFAEPWTLNGDLDLLGAPDLSASARIDGAQLTNTNGTVAASGYARINTPFVMTGGNLDVLANSELDMRAATTISGGDFDIFANGFLDFDAATTISGGNFDVFATGRIDFDDTINITGGTFDLNGGADFANRARISGDATINFANATVEASGFTQINPAIIINSGNFVLFTDDELELNGSSITINDGNFTVGNGSTLDINGPLTISGTPAFSTVSGSDPALGQVRFDGPTTYNGGTLTFLGMVRQAGDATVSILTTINADTFDFDSNVVTLPLWTLNAPFTVNADNVETFGSNTVHPDFDINNAGVFGGNLTVNLPGADTWTLAGTITLNGADPNGQLIFTPNMISGSPVNITGTVDTTGRATIAAKANISGTVHTTAANALIRLNGGNLADPNTLAGGSITGDGTLGTLANNALHGHGTISINLITFPDSDILADNGTLTITGDITDVGTIGTADTDGTLNIPANWNATVADLVNLQGGSVIGGTITNPAGKTISGFGTIATNQVSNSGTITADGGELILDYTLNPDLDGAGAGIIEAVNGDLTIVDPATDAHNGTANVGPNRTMTFQQGWNLATNGKLDLNGGATLSTAARVAGSSQTLQGLIEVDQNAAFQIATTFTSNATVDLPQADDLLYLQDDSSIAANTTFTGLGKLINHTNATLTPANNADIAVEFSNAGTLLMTGGTLTGDDFTNQAAGQILGDGTLTPNKLINNGTIAAKGTTLTIDTTQNPDLDGITGNGHIKAVDGNLTIAGPLNDTHDGTATIGGKYTMQFNSGWTLTNNGNLVIQGGPDPQTAAILRVPNPATQSLNGIVAVSGIGVFLADTALGPAARVAIRNAPDTLFLDGDTTINAGTTFTGDGTLFNTQGNTLTLANGATIGVNTTNAGNIEVGASPGAATIAQLSLTNSSYINIELADPLFGPTNNPDPGDDHDQIAVTADVVLNGTLNIDLLKDFDQTIIPSDQFVIMTWADNPTDSKFDTVTFNQPSIPGLLLDLAYQPTKLTLTASAMNGDADLDGDVDLEDLVILAANFDTPVTNRDWRLANFDFDMDVDADDLNLMAENFTGSPDTLTAFAASLGVTLTQTPEPATLVGVVLGFGCLASRRRR